MREQPRSTQAGMDVTRLQKMSGILRKCLAEPAGSSFQALRQFCDDRLL